MKLSLVVPFALSVIACGAKEVPRESVGQLGTTQVTAAPMTAPVVAKAAAPAEPVAPVPVAAPARAVPMPSMTSVAAPRPLAAPTPRPARSSDVVRRAPLVGPGLVPAAPVSPTPAMYTSPQGQDGPTATSFRSTGGQMTPGDFAPRPLQVAPTGNQLTNLTTSPSFGGSPRSF